MDESSALMIEGIEREAQRVNTIEELKDWTRRSIRPFLPHESLISCQGHIHAAGVGMDFAVTIDYPAEYLQRLRNRAGGIDSPLLRRWFDTREPVVFEIDDPWTDCPAGWLQAFRDFDLRNALAHAKHHLTRIFDRLGVDSRSQLIARLAEHELRVAPGYVTKIL